MMPDERDLPDIDNLRTVEDVIALDGWPMTPLDECPVIGTITLRGRSQ